MSDIIVDYGISDENTTTFEKLLVRVKKSNPNTNLELIQRAYKFSEEAHRGQTRRSGLPYLTHPASVAGILADLRLDDETVITGLLHDTVEDTDVTLEDIREEFGESVALLVDGVTKITQISFRNTHEKQGENIRKMLLAMGKDIRVILVKLADRLHNMRTLNHMPYNKQIQIAQETLDIYSPLASRFGISSLKVELEDLSFRYISPDQYYDLVQKINRKKKERERYIEDVCQHLREVISKNHPMNFTISGRPKHLHSVYQKMISDNLEFEQVHDLLAFRVLVDTIPECYEVLGEVHSLWKPIPGRIKDYIAMPKGNDYQSLHTTVIGPEGERIEIQIRTGEMHLVAERGIAAHWSYKEGNNQGASDIESARFEWLRELIAWHQKMGDSDELLETVKSDLFDQEIYVFTPSGDVKELPENASPVDFAFSIHTDVGLHCSGARVNGKMVSLRHKLKNGDTVEVHTNKNQLPSKDWLKFVVTNRAKSKIRAHVKEEQRGRALTIGRDLVDKDFRKLGIATLKVLKGDKLESFLKDQGAHDLDEIYCRVGYGKMEVRHIVERFSSNKEDGVAESQKSNESFISKVFKPTTRKKRKSISVIEVDGMPDVLVHFAKCCLPIPGDPISGFITRGRGITIHRVDCQRTFEMDLLRRVDVNWSTEIGGHGFEQVVRIRILSQDLQGLLKSMTDVLTMLGCNIHNAQVKTTRDKKAVCIFDVGIGDTEKLNKTIYELQKIRGVINVIRMIS